MAGDRLQTTRMTTRLRALDVFRGATVALMILVNNPGSWAALYPPLAHAPWHGCTPTDLVFPFFLFAVGNALALVMPGLRAAGAAVFWPRIIRRTLLIFAIGLLLNAAPLVRWDAAGELVLRDFSTLRWMGVLQRIALCFGTAAAIVWWCGRRGPRGPLLAATALLLGYWAACAVLGAPGDVYSLGGWFGTAIDRALLGAAHLYQGEGVPFDPEGLASTAPAVAQVLLGWWAGQMVQQMVQQTQIGGGSVAQAPLRALLLRLWAWGALLLLVAGLWQLQMPLNKKVWTSSYVLFTTGGALWALALCVQWLQPRGAPSLAPVPAPAPAPAPAPVPEPIPAPQLGSAPVRVRGPTRVGEFCARFFEVFGRNPLFIFVLSGLVPRVLSLVRWPVGVDAQGQPLWTTPLPWLYQHLFAPLGSVFTADPRLGSLLYAVAHLLPYAALAWWMDRRGLYVRV